jgi:hypothetical protein
MKKNEVMKEVQRQEGRRMEGRKGKERKGKERKGKKGRKERKEERTHDSFCGRLPGDVRLFRRRHFSTPPGTQLETKTND